MELKQSKNYLVYVRALGVRLQLWEVEVLQTTKECVKLKECIDSTNIFWCKKTEVEIVEAL